MQSETIFIGGSLVVPSRTRSVFNLCSMILILLTAAKMAWVVGGTPLIGYGNNYDFLKQSACTGLWTDNPAGKIVPSPQRPLPNLILDAELIPAHCLHSTDNMFSYGIARWHHVGERIDLREVGVSKAVFVLSAFLALLALVSSPALRFCLSLAFFLTFSDLALLAYFNTLYFEVAGIVGCFLVIAFAIILATAVKRPSYLASAYGVAALLLLAFAKQQYTPLAAVFSLIYAAIILQKWSLQGARVAALFLILAVAMPVTYMKVNSTRQGPLVGISFANLTDTFLGAVLAEAPDKQAALRRVGLPESCMAGIGLNWFSPGLQQNHPCPEIQHLSRARLIPLFVTQPTTFFQPMRKALLGARPLYPVVLGDVEDPLVRDDVRYRLSRLTSLSWLISQLPEAMFLMWGVLSFMSAIGLALMPIVQLLRARFSSRATLAALCVGFGGLVNSYAVASSVFGDGYADLARHALSLIIGASFQVTGLSAGAILIVRRYAASVTRIEGQVGQQAFDA